MAGLAVFVAPLLVTQLAFRRYAGIRSTYLQTVRALSRVTEVGGYVESGHSRRVSVLAVAIGRELGMSEPDLLELEYAALMHDIGQLSLRDPIPGGATVLASRPDQQRIAGLGADVITKAGVLDQVAETRPPPEPSQPAGDDRRRRSAAGSSTSPTPTMTSSAPRPTGTAARPRSSASRLDTAFEYDPAVVEALEPGRRPLALTGGQPCLWGPGAWRSYPAWADTRRTGVRVGAGCQPRRDRAAGDQDRRAGWASRPSRSTPRPTPTCRSCARPTRRSLSARLSPPRAISTSTR